MFHRDSDNNVLKTVQGEEWRDLLINRRMGQIEPHSLANIITMLTYSKCWKGVFVFNQFSGEIMVQQCPPYMSKKDFLTRPLSHFDVVMTTSVLEFFGLTSTPTKTLDAIKAVAHQIVIHPVRDYFNSLRWDGKKRIDFWLHKYLKACQQPSDYLSAVGSKWLIAGVRRVFIPGCKFDTMLVLEGAQGIGKSRALRTMATLETDQKSDYFTDALRFENIALPSSIMGLQGKLIIEFAELSGMNRKEIEAVKGWITLQTDEIQKKYENTVTRLERQFILAGTTNDDTYLRDPTGNRRFLPVLCSDKIDISGLERDREQLWAEAVVRHKEGYECVTRKDMTSISSHIHMLQD